MRSSDPEGRPSPISMVMVVVAVLALVFILVLTWARLFPYPETLTFVDLDYYRAALKVVVAQEPLYSSLPYPPVAVLVIAWLGGLPVLLGNQLWTALTLITALGLAALLTWRSLQARGQEPLGAWDFVGSAPITAFLLIASLPMISQLTTGQVTLFITTLSFLDVARVVPRKAQGVLVGIAGAIKLTPLIFIPYYLVTGQRRQAAVATASFGATTALGFAMFPGDSLFFWAHLGKNDQFGDPLRTDNLSIHAAVARLIPATASMPLVWISLGLVVAVFAMLRARKHFLAGEVMEAVLTIGASATVLAPIAWPHYHVWVVLAGLWLVSFSRRRHQVIGLVVCIVFSLPWSVLVSAVARGGNPLVIAAVDLQVLIPVLIGLFGLPHRPATVAATTPSHRDAVPTAA